MHLYMHVMDGPRAKGNGNQEEECAGCGGTCGGGIFLSISSHQLCGGCYNPEMPVAPSLRTCTRSGASISIFIELDLDFDLDQDIDLVFEFVLYSSIPTSTATPYLDFLPRIQMGYMRDMGVTGDIDRTGGI